ncbi:hypothetical protein [Micromonospora sp. NPDC047738]|uniref:hypothetical protein n=1 Tax=unclassified Micromonospora TaxID=2617518 RepID=UPI0033FCEB4D
MAVTMPIGRRIAAGLLGSALALLAAGAPAAAAPNQSSDTLSVTAQQLVLEPTDRGYVGTLQVTVTNGSPTAQSFGLTFTEPAVGSLTTTDPLAGCVYLEKVNGLRQIHCGGGAVIEPGASQLVRIGFHVLTRTRDYPMIVDGGQIMVLPETGGIAADTTTYATLFRSTKGKLRNPVPYVQDTLSNASITAHDVTLYRTFPGAEYHGEMRVTVTWNGDAGHDFLQVEANLPAGALVTGTDPWLEPNGFPGTWFEVPGHRFMAGESRTLTVYFSAPADTLPGALGTGSFNLRAQLFIDELADVSPADNTPSFALTAIDQT